MCVLTVEEAVVFEAASTEQRVEGVQALFALHRASVWTVDVRRAFRGQRAGQLLLRQLLIPDVQTQKEEETLTEQHFRVSTESVSEFVSTRRRKHASVHGLEAS